MTRYLTCLKCGSEMTLYEEDRVDGWKMRKHTFVAKKPASLAIVANGESFPLTQMVCDLCNVNLPDGSTVIGVTMWMPAREDEPEQWENEYAATTPPSVQ